VIHNLPITSLPGGRRLVSLLINTAALLLILQRLGASGTVLQVPNNMFFQRAVRRWR
jgi:hypothetical protein